MSIDAILGQAEKTSGTSAAKNEYAENKEMFLQLLVTQLSNQDPLNPVEDKEFIAQLATFTQVEELQKLNEGMTSMVEAYDREQFTSALNMLGARVLSGGSTVYKSTDASTGEYSVTPIYFSSEADMSSVTVNVYGKSGQTVYSEELGSLQAGDYPFTWDGTNMAGMAVADGEYTFAVVAYDLNGERILTDNQVFGDVMQVEKTDDGYRLYLADGRNVKLEDVIMAGYANNAGGGESGTDQDSGPDTDPDTGSDTDPDTAP